MSYLVYCPRLIYLIWLISLSLTCLIWHICLIGLSLISLICLIWLIGLSLICLICILSLTYLSLICLICNSRNNFDSNLGFHYLFQNHPTPTSPFHATPPHVIR